jgi:hypothetical protein
MDLIKEANMRKALTAAMAAITLGGAALATAAPAQAQHHGGGYHGGGGYRGGYGGHYGRGNGGAAVAAGVVGLALGAAIASNNHGYYDRGYYGAPAYAYGYGPGYGYGYRTCETTRWVWDPYYGRRVPVREAYAC